MNNEIHNTYMNARKGVMKMVSRIVPPKEVEDIVQETYVRLCQIEAPQSIVEPKSFLYRTAKNLALDHLKKAETRLADTLDTLNNTDEHFAGGFNSVENSMEDSTYKTVVSQQEFEHFCESVRYLPAQCRKAFVLKKVYGYSQKEIAKAMQITESTVEKHIAMGIKKCTQYRMQTQLHTNNNTQVKEASK